MEKTDNILIVDDDPGIRRLLVDYLARNGFSALAARDGREMWQMLERHVVDLVVLDLMLPDTDGLTLCRDLRGKTATSTMPVLMLTARGEETDRIIGIEMGADDYLVKPFNLDELVARVFALRRRSQGWASSELRLGALCVNSRQRQVKLANEEIHLSDREFRLLVALIEMPGSVLSVAQLEERLYGWGEEIASNSIEVQLHRLRRKLGKEWIRNVRGIGFKLVDPAA